MAVSQHDLSILEKILDQAPNTKNDPKLVEDPSEQNLSNDQKSQLKFYDDLIVKLDSQNKHKEALKFCDEAINFCPNRAKSYNNRAQIYRLLSQDIAAKNDIEKCLELSEFKGIAAAQAYIQRGSLYMKNKNKVKAIEDFKKAGNLGSKQGKEMALGLNDMAELCGSAVNEE